VRATTEDKSISKILLSALKQDKCQNWPLVENVEHGHCGASERTVPHPVVDVDVVVVVVGG